MKKVMVCGCGAQGSTICRRLDEEPNIEEVVCADYNLAAAEAVCKLMKKGTPKQVNAAHVDEIAVALEYMRDGKINADELITREVTLDTLVEDGFEYLIQHGPENIKVLIKISE